jgi:hypothetical protein
MVASCACRTRSIQRARAPGGVGVWLLCTQRVSQFVFSPVVVPFGSRLPGRPRISDVILAHDNRGGAK